MRRLREPLAVVLGGTALGLLAWWLLGLGSVRARPAYLAAIGITVLALRPLLRLSARPTDAQRSVVLGGEPDVGPRSIPDLVTLEHRLAWGSVDVERFESRVRPTLVGIAAERLRIRHGVDHTREPDRARQIVGDHLWQLMTGPTRHQGRPPSRREMSRIVAEIERI